MKPHKDKPAIGVCQHVWWPFSHSGAFSSLAEGTQVLRQKRRVTRFIRIGCQPGAIEFLHRFNWRILQEDSFRALAATWGYIIAKYLEKWLFELRATPSKPNFWSGRGEGIEGCEVSVFGSWQFITKKGEVSKIWHFCYPFHWLHTQANAFGSLLSEHRDTCLRGETSSGDKFILQARWTWVHFRGKPAGWKRTCLWNDLRSSVCRTEEKLTF